MGFRNHFYTALCGMGLAGLISADNFVTRSASEYVDLGTTDGQQYKLDFDWSAGTRWFTNSVLTSGALQDINNSVNSGSNYYADQTSHVAVATPGSSFSMTFDLTDNSSVGKVWVDWNHNGTFEEPAEIAGYVASRKDNANNYWNAYVDGATPETITINVPKAAALPSLPFQTRVRIRTTNGDTSAPSEILPTSSFSLEGQMQDYVLSIPAEGSNSVKIVNNSKIDSTATISGSTISSMMWVKFDSTAGHGSIIAVGDNGDAANAAFGFWYNPSANTANLYNGLNGGGTIGLELNEDQWTHLAFTSDSANSKIFLYENGVLKHTWTKGQNAVTNAILRLAQDLNGGSLAQNVEYDEVSIWNGNLTVAEIQANYNSGKGKWIKGDEANLLLNWKFEDDPQASTVYDNTGNGRNGSITGTKDTDFSWASNNLFSTPLTISSADRAIWQQNSSGVANITVKGLPGKGYDSLWVRLTKVDSAKPGSNVDWQDITSSISSGEYSTTVNNVAAGWYTVEVQSRLSGKVVATESNLVGVGDVYIVGGQSNSCNSGQTTISTNNESVNSYNFYTGKWVNSDDPQPVVMGTGGTFFPSLGDHLTEELEIPIGFVGTGIPGVSLVYHSNHKTAPLGLASNPPGYWQVDGGVAESSCYFVHMKPAIEALKNSTGFKAILWHQGEMDALWLSSQADYERELKELINQSRVDAGFTVPWYIALASYMDINNAANNSLIENAQINVINDDAGISEVYRGARTNGFKELDYLFDYAHHKAAGLVEHGKRWSSALGKVFITTNSPSVSSATLEVMNGSDQSITIKQSTDGSTWTDAVVSIESTRDAVSDTYTATVTSLTPGTAYQFKAVYGSEESNISSLTTVGGVSISSPVNRTIWQQDASGVADVTITGTATAGSYDALLVKFTKVDADGVGSDIAWTDITSSVSGNSYSKVISGVQAGWYTMSVKITKNSSDVQTESILVGIGDVFVACGQSNAANYGETKGATAYEYVNSKDFNTGLWQKTVDPQPGSTGPNNGAGNDKGSVWPDLGDKLAAWAGVPVGFVCCAYGGSSVGDWDPDNGNSYYHSLLKPALQSVAATGFKAVIWHQGEGDAYYGTASTYQANLEKVIAKTRVDTGRANLQWGVALASDYPGSGGSQQESEVETAQLAVIAADQYVFRGARTNGFDQLGLLGSTDRWHFNDAGLQEHANRWFEALGTVAYAATNVSPNGFTANWHETFDAVSYSVVVDDDADFSSPITTVSSLSGTSASINTLLPSGTVYYRVVANNGTRNLAPSAAVSLNVSYPAETADKLLALDGTTSLISDGSFSYDLSKEFITFVGWVKPKSSANQAIFYVKSSDSKVLGIHYVTDGANKLLTWDGGGNESFATGSIVTNQWFHLAVVMGQNGTKAYVNGVLDMGNNPASLKNLQFTNGEAVKLIVGGFSDGLSYKANAEFDEISLWNRELSKAEIEELMTKPVSAGDDLVLSWNFDNNDLSDSSANGLDATYFDGSTTSFNQSEVFRPAPRVDNADYGVAWKGVPAGADVAGMIVTANPAITEDNAYLWYGITTADDQDGTTNDSLGSVDSTMRLIREWKIEEQYVNARGSVSFNKSALGIGHDVSTYRLLRRTASISQSSGFFMRGGDSDFETVSSSATDDGDVITFSSVSFDDGFYTLGTTGDVLSPAYGVEVVQSGKEFAWTVEDEISVRLYKIVNADTGAVLETVQAEGLDYYAVTLPEGVNAKLIVVDNTGYEQDFFPEDGDINITPYKLKKGWNLISITSENADLRPLNAATTGAVWGWTGSAYEVVDSAKPTDAVWVYANRDIEVVVFGYKSTAKIALSSGWNMCGPVENSQVPDDAVGVYSWDSIYTEIADRSATLIEGVGYWIFAL